MELTPNFSLEEFTRTGHKDLQEENIEEAENYKKNILNTAIELEHIWSVINSVYERGIYIVISSGFRCKKLNDAEGSTDKSQHRIGQAADFNLYNTDNKVVIPVHTAMRMILEERSQIPEWHQLIEENYKNSHWLHLGIATGVNDEQVLLCKDGKYETWSI
jgi:hypothetical protein